MKFLSIASLLLSCSLAALPEETRSINPLTLGTGPISEIPFEFSINLFNEVFKQFLGTPFMLNTLTTLIYSNHVKQPELFDRYLQNILNVDSSDRSVLCAQLEGKIAKFLTWLGIFEFFQVYKKDLFSLHLVDIFDLVVVHFEQRIQVAHFLGFIQQEYPNTFTEDGFNFVGEFSALVEEYFDIFAGENGFFETRMNVTSTHIRILGIHMQIKALKERESVDYSVAPTIQHALYTGAAHHVSVVDYYKLMIAASGNQNFQRYDVMTNLKAMNNYFYRHNHVERNPFTEAFALVKQRGCGLNPESERIMISILRPEVLEWIPFAKLCTQIVPNIMLNPRFTEIPESKQVLAYLGSIGEVNLPTHE